MSQPFAYRKDVRMLMIYDGVVISIYKLFGFVYRPIASDLIIIMSCAT